MPLFLRGREGLVYIVVKCVKWGLIWCLVGLAILWRRYGWPEMTERWDALVFVFFMGAMCRFAYEMAWEKVIFEPTHVRLRAQGSRYLQSDVKRLTVRMLRHDRMRLQIEWTNERRRPLVFVGKVDQPAKSLTVLGQYYEVLWLDEANA